MSSSKKSGPLHRITVSFTMNDDGCSVPELTITRDFCTEVSRPLEDGSILTSSSKGTAHVSMESLAQHQREAINTRLRLAADGWVHATFKERERSHRRMVRSFLQEMASLMGKS